MCILRPINSDQNLNCLIIRYLTLIWDQDSSSVSISVKCNSLLEVREEDVYVKVTEDSLTVEVKEGNIVHVLPLSPSPLALWSFTQPHTVVLTVRAGKLAIKFDKKTEAEWRRLGKDKFSWITFNYDSSNLDTEEFNNNSTEDNPELKMPKKDYSILLPEGATEEDVKGTDSDSDSDTDTDPDLDQDNDNPNIDDENIEDNYVDTDTESGIIC